MLFLITSCTMVTAPLEFAPNGDIVYQALLMSIKQNQESISQNLEATIPQLEVKKIKVGKIDPIIMGNLPTYHLQGTYNLILNLPNQEAQQNQNYFDLYLQRQKEGKTWRLLKKEADKWYSYLVH